MITIRCNKCGGISQADEKQATFQCDYCDSIQPLPKFFSEEKTSQFNRAANLRMKKDFDRAIGVYENLIALYPDESEAYWGLCLCKYGIEYVEDPKSGRRIPTCHRTLPVSILNDEDYRSTIKHGTELTRGGYEKDAKEIEEVQNRIKTLASQIEPYDIFICYKETDDATKARTEDSEIAQDIYTDLISKGYKVFYARKTLSSVAAGKDYEAYIYSALSTAKVMLAIGTKPEYYEAVWVKNEWSRYIKMTDNDAARALIPCFKNMTGYDLPDEFTSRNLQALDMSSPVFFGSLMSNIERIIHKNQANQEIPTNTATNDTLLERASMFLADGDFESVRKYCNRVLDSNPKNSYAYFYLMMADFGIRSVREITGLNQAIDLNSNYKKAFSFADEKFKIQLQGYSDIINKRIGEKNRQIQEVNSKKAEIESEIADSEGKLKQISAGISRVEQQIKEVSAGLNNLRNDIERKKKNLITLKAEQKKKHWTDFALWPLTLILVLLIVIPLSELGRDFGARHSDGAIVVIFVLLISFMVLPVLFLMRLFGGISMENCDNGLGMFFVVAPMCSALLIFIIMAIIGFGRFGNDVNSLIDSSFMFFFEEFNEWMGGMDSDDNIGITMSIFVFLVLWDIICIISWFILLIKKLKKRKSIKMLDKTITASEIEYQQKLNSNEEVTALASQLNENQLLYQRVLSDSRAKIQYMCMEHNELARKYNVSSRISLPSWVR